MPVIIHIHHALNKAFLCETVVERLQSGAVERLHSKVSSVGSQILARPLIKCGTS